MMTCSQAQELCQLKQTGNLTALFIQAGVLQKLGDDSCFVPPMRERYALHLERTLALTEKRSAAAPQHDAALMVVAMSMIMTVTMVSTMTMIIHFNANPPRHGATRASAGLPRMRSHRSIEGPRFQGICGGSSGDPEGVP